MANGRTTRMSARRVPAAAVLALGIGLCVATPALADPEDTVAPSGPGVAVVESHTSDNADPAAVTACGQYAEILDTTAQYYGEFAEEFESYANPDYNDPAISASNETGRTALRQGAGAAMSAANTPGLSPDIANPMRSWSWGATKLLVKMGLRSGGETMNTTATEMNTNAEAVQKACASAGTHA